MNVSGNKLEFTELQLEEGLHVEVLKAIKHWANKEWSAERSKAWDSIMKWYNTLPLKYKTYDVATKDQINFIHRKCKKANINVMAFINSGKKQYNDIREVRRETAYKMIKNLTMISNDRHLIDENILGYEEG